MENKIPIQILDRHINNSLRLSILSCPLALAGKDKGIFNQDWVVETNEVRNNSGVVEFALCDDAKDFVYQFDRGRKVSPCLVHLEKV